MKTLMRTFFVTVLAIPLLLPIEPVAAQNPKGRRNTALGLTGVAAYHLLKGHSREAIGFGAGALYAWKRQRDAARHQRRLRAARLARAQRTRRSRTARRVVRRTTRRA